MGKASVWIEFVCVGEDCVGVRLCVGRASVWIQFVYV